MVADVFESLLQELSKALKVDLRPDKNNSCLIKLKEGVKVQLELDHSGRFLVLGADLGSISVGRYRENLFRQALMANGLPPPRHGIFAYSKRADSLVLHAMLEVKELNEERLTQFFQTFVEKVIYWNEAIKRGEIPEISEEKAAKGGSGMFGLQS
jgi:hypothetical protein